MCIAKKWQNLLKGNGFLPKYIALLYLSCKVTRLHLTDDVSFAAWMRWSCSTVDGRIPHSEPSGYGPDVTVEPRSTDK